MAPGAAATVRNDVAPAAASQPPAADTVEISDAAREALRQSQAAQDAARQDSQAQQAALQRISTQ